jgi:CubicO group peptidase (beta-lactamase class C family)
MSMHNPDLDAAIQSLIQTHHIVGLSACRVQDGEVVWANGYGWADIAARRPMTPDVIQNIASISKTFTCTALMQQWEKKKFQLDDPVSDHLPFVVRHPNHPGTITFRQLLTHTAAIADSKAYETSYACGDPVMSLEEWLREYLLPEGKFYDPEKNFKPYAPGGGWNYSNVAFGLLGYLVECMAGEPLNIYCRKNIFEPLGMRQSGWLLSEVDINNHAVLYGLPGIPEGLKVLFAPGVQVEEGDPHPFCLYSFPNFADGLVRTSARELARYGAAFAGKGERLGEPILKKETVARCLSQESVIEIGPRLSGVQGLTWYSHGKTPNGMPAWGHDGGDPGVHTRLRIREDGAVIAILLNCNILPEGMDALADLVWEAA